MATGIDIFTGHDNDSTGIIAESSCVCIDQIALGILFYALVTDEATVMCENHLVCFQEEKQVFFAFIAGIQLHVAPEIE